MRSQKYANYILDQKQWQSYQQRKQPVLPYEEVLSFIYSDTSLLTSNRKLRAAVAMAEIKEKEEINYASVVFKNKNNPPPESKFTFFFFKYSTIRKDFLKHATDMLAAWHWRNVFWTARVSFYICSVCGIWTHIVQ